MTGPPGGSGELGWFDEAAKTAGFENQLRGDSVPESVTFLSDPTALSRPQEVVETLARFLVKVHSMKIAIDGPLAGSSAVPSIGPEAVLEDARLRVEDGTLADISFDSPYTGQEPSRLLDVARSFLPALDQGSPVVGLSSVASLGVDEGEIVAWTTPYRAGIGDPYMDLTFMGAAVAAAIGPAAAPALFDAYGLTTPELARVEFWSLIYQLRSRSQD